jgi:hypothetical protein
LDKKKRNPQVALNPPKEEGGGDKRRIAQEEEARQRQDGFCQKNCCSAIDYLIAYVFVSNEYPMTA